MNKKQNNRFESTGKYLLYIISIHMIALLSCINDGSLDISSGISHKYLIGNWRCTAIHSRTWEQDSIIGDTIISNDSGLFSIQFLDTVIITKRPYSDTFYMDTSKYLFTNNNLLYVIDNHPYFMGNLETIHLDSTLLLRDLAVSSSNIYPYQINDWYEDVYYLEKMN
jgi:hypothetical protein